MNIADFFIGYAAGIVSLFLFVGLSVRAIIKHKEYYMPKMMAIIRDMMVKRANNARRQPAGAHSTDGTIRRNT